MTQEKFRGPSAKRHEQFTKRHKKSGPKSALLAARVKFLRSGRSVTLRQLSEASGASYSNLSKVESGKLSPTFDTMERIARGLGVSISELLAFESIKGQTGRMAVTREGQGVVHKTPSNTYRALCIDVTDKSIVPLVVKLHAHEMKDFGDMLSHDGEEVLFVLDGQVEVQT
jgi:transcriptional regulator with XRE-family HTH domain